MEHGFQRYFRWLSLLLTTPSLFGPGRWFFRGAWSSLRARRLHMDVPIALALAAGWLRGAWNTLIDHGPIYFDGVAALVFLLLVGRFLQRRAQRAAGDATELLGSLSPATARVIVDGAVAEIPAEALLPGMTLEVRAGETVAADGVVLLGNSAMDLSLLSGESSPVAVTEGDRVWAGTINRGALLTVSVDASGEETRLGRILREVEAGARRRAPVVQLADRLAGWFVAVILVAAIVTAAVWWRLDPSAALDHAIALLIVTCPCALALATPLAVSTAIGRAARAGILIKGGDALEQLAHPARVMLDKTGTLTAGRTVLEHWDGATAVRPLVLALERHAMHPVAEGFRDAWGDLDSPEASDVRYAVGGGLEGLVAGHRVVVGSPVFVRRRVSGEIPAWPALPARLTPILVAVDDRIVARAGFGDPIRPEVAAVLARLRARGHRLEILSGDDPAVVTEIGRALGFAGAECRGAATPEQKLAIVERAASTSPVLVVGDGVNDAAAMARATVGIAVRGGAEASLAAADVYLARPGLCSLVELIDGARRTLRVIRRNIAFSLVYNAIGAGLAITGVIDPLIAAILMPMSSLTVVLASWGSRTFPSVPVPPAAGVAAAPSMFELARDPGVIP
jgi:Cu2+-exporting ATPase